MLTPPSRFGSCSWTVRPTLALKKFWSNAFLTRLAHSSPSSQRNEQLAYAHTLTLLVDAWHQDHPTTTPATSEQTNPQVIIPAPSAADWHDCQLLRADLLQSFEIPEKIGQEARGS